MEKLRYRIKMEDFDLTLQEKDDFCVCSVLQAIMDKNGIKMSQDEITDFLAPGKKKSKITGFFLDDPNIKNFLNEKGFAYKTYWRNQVLFNEIDFVLEEMKDIEGIVSMNGHAYLFAGYNRFNVFLIEPCRKEVKEYTSCSLDDEMRSLNNMGGFGLIKKLK